MSSPKDLPANVTANTLELLFRGKTEGVGKSSIFPIDPELVEFEPDFNLRTKDDLWEAHVERLYLAMKNGAAVPPIDVRVSAGKIICVDGEGRTTAAMRMREEFPDFKLQARQFTGNEQDRVLHMLGTGSGQKTLSPLEQGLGFLRLTKYGMANAEIAAKLGISVVTVANNLQLAEAPVNVQNMIRAGEVSSTAARDALQGGADGVAALELAVEEQRLSNPAPAADAKGKPAKKKKVTAKTLKGTPAEKKSAAKQKAAEKEKKAKAKADAKAAKEAAKAAKSTPPAPVIAEDEISITVKKTDAQAVVDFLRSNTPNEDQVLVSFTSALEMALM